MKSIFKIAPSTPAGKEKISDTDFQAHYPGVNMNMMYKEISPYIQQATILYVLPFVGEELYDDLATKIETDTLTDPKQVRIAFLLKSAIAYYTITLALPQKKTVIASMGAVENLADGGTTQSSQWGFKSTLWSVTQTADKLLDKLLAELEQYVKDSVSYFDLWKNSKAYEAGAADFFRTTADFQYRHPISNSRRTFIAMLPIMREMAEEKILPILCDEYYAQIKAAVRQLTPLAADLKIIQLVQKALAKWTVFAASDALAVIPEQEGFRVISSVDGIDTRTFSTETIKGAIIGIKEQAEQSARTATADLIAYLYANAATYTVWAASPCNKAGSAAKETVICDGPGGVFL